MRDLIVCSLIGVTVSLNQSANDCAQRMAWQMASYVVILMVFSLTSLLSLMCSQRYRRSAFLAWNLRLLHLTQSFWIFKVALTLKDDSRRMECIEDPKTLRLLLLTAGTVVITAFIIFCDFIRELAILIEICILSHMRKADHKRSRV